MNLRLDYRRLIEDAMRNSKEPRWIMPKNATSDTFDTTINPDLLNSVIGMRSTKTILDEYLDRQKAKKAKEKEDPEIEVTEEEWNALMEGA